MARRSLFSGIPEFLAVAELKSFRAAAVQLRVTPGAVSQAVKALEDQVGLPLFLRTTRSVGLTEAGAHFLTRLRPAAAEIREAVDGLEALRGRPVGTLRLSVPRIALDTVIGPMLPEFRRRHPEIDIEIDVEDASIDLSSRGYDAGIRLGEFIERDMIAVKLTPDVRWLVVGAPSYFESRGWPRSPHDLIRHECIRYRFPSARTVYRWEFVEGGRRYSLDPPGGIMVTDHLAMNAMAVRGLGLGYTADIVAAGDLAAGRLIPVLGEYLPATAGLYLYFPERSRDQAKLRAFITVTTEMLSRANRAAA